MKTKEDFLLWEKRSHDTIDFKKIYADITNNLLAGLLLSQIVYWHLPNAQGNSKLTVTRNGKEYLVKQREDWWNEIRLSVDQYKKAINILISKNIISIEYHKSSLYQANKVSFIYLNFEVLVKLLNNFKENPSLKKSYPKTPKDLYKHRKKITKENSDGVNDTNRITKVTVSMTPPRRCQRHRPIYTETTTKTTKKEEEEKAPFPLETAPMAQLKNDVENSNRSNSEIMSLPSGLELLNKMRVYPVKNREKEIKDLTDKYPIDNIRHILKDIDIKIQEGVLSFFTPIYLVNALDNFDAQEVAMDANLHGKVKRFCLDFFTRETDALNVYEFYRKITQKGNKQLKTLGSAGKDLNTRKIDNIKFLVETYGEEAFLKSIRKFIEEDKAGTFKEYTLAYLSNRLKYDFTHASDKQKFDKISKKSEKKEEIRYIVPIQYEKQEDFYTGADAPCNWLFKCECGEIINRWAKLCPGCKAQFEWDQINFVDTDHFADLSKMVI